MPPRSRVHLLDVGTQKYGDCVLCELDGETVLIDGAHSGDTEHIASQVSGILNEPNAISLLIVTHAHADHIGCIPSLVANGDIEVEWALVPDPDLGFGRTTDSPFTPPDAENALDRRARILARALREEDRSDVPDDELRAFLDSLDNQEADYRAFIRTLRERGANVVLYGNDDPEELIARFSTIGLQIIGPNQEQVESAAEHIRAAVDFTTQVSADFLAADADTDLTSAYRALAGTLTDQGKSRPGAAINMTSIVTMFEVGGRKFLFGGDMEFEKPEPRTDEIVAGVEEMRQTIRDLAPFDFYKLCHHGSWNGFGTDILSDLGTTRNLGICTGEESPSHPAKKTLDLLRRNEDDLRWARTDRNGRTTFSFGQKVHITPSRGTLNNSEPNRRDTGGGAGGAVVPAPATATIRSSAESQSRQETTTALDDSVEVCARIPHAKTRVTITIDVEPGSGGNGHSPKGTQAKSGERPALDVGDNVRGLLFVTSRDALFEHIGPTAREAIDMLRSRGATVIDSLPGGLTHASEVVPVVRAELTRTRAKGVVILGGYDVVPSQSLDALPAELRRTMNGSGDPDNFIVWSDDVYGDYAGDSLPDVPVSRIPDGRSARLVASALSPAPRATGSCAVRNSARPFADRIYTALPNARPMLRSEPATFANPTYSLDTDYVYLMLHGEYSDGSRFWGEETDDDIEAVNISNIPSPTGAVVFTGCCWGGLTVDKPAGRLIPGQSLGVKTPDSSIALAFLERGARAFVGCTGAHYSPLDDPYDYFGAPMHQAFWSEVLAEIPPAQALFNAKAAYARGMPHGQTSTAGRAIEFKIFRQFTCLGLGW